MFAVLGATSAIALVSEIAAASPNFVNLSDRIQLPNSKVAQLNEPQVLASPPNLTGKWKANAVAKLQAGCTTPACEKP